MLERRGAALNIASFVGHSALRSYVMGEAATQRVATDAEIAEMRALALEAMRAGAVGFSTSTSPAHNGEGGVPMPSRLADEKELRALVGSRKGAGRGVFMLKKGAAFREVLEDQKFRQAIRAELAKPAHFRLFNGQWGQVRVVESARKELDQRSIAELAGPAGKDPLDFMLDLALEESLDTVFTALLLNSDEEAVGRTPRPPPHKGSPSGAGAP